MSLAIQMNDYPQRNIQIFRNENPQPEQWNIPLMAAQTETEENLYERTDNAQQKQGMDNFPMEIYNQLIDYTLSNGKYRDAMLLICMANWGMRISDLLRVRYCHICDSNGRLKEYFTLPNGEKKTGKLNTYYNNTAVWKIIMLYLSKTNINLRPYDYLFISESGNAPRKTLQQIEAEEKYGYSITLKEKHIKETEKRKADLLRLYSHGTITESDFSEMNNTLKSELENLHKNIADLKQKLENYISPNTNIISGSIGYCQEQSA